MSLQLALDQIQRPTWWFEESNRAEYKNQWSGSDSGRVKKETVLAHIRQCWPCRLRPNPQGYRLHHAVHPLRDCEADRGWAYSQD